MKKLIAFPVMALFAALAVRAHCPLCTAGAAVAAGGAAAFGVSTVVIGVFLGAFAVSTGWWVGRMLPKKVPLQLPLLVVLAFVTTIVPLLPLLSEHHALYLPFGAYGTTLAVNVFLWGSVIGGGILRIGPWISSQVTRVRGKQVPYQGIILTFALLIVVSLVLQVMV